MLGFVDTLDILKHIADALPTDAELKRDEMHTLQIAGRAFGLITLDRTIDLSGRDYMVQMFEDDPATHALDVFASVRERALRSSLSLPPHTHPPLLLRRASAR
jgi:hypothetical protein